MELTVQPVPESPADQLALLTEIRDQLLAQNTHRQKQLILLRVCAAACALLALAVLLTCAVLLPKASQTLSEAEAAIAALNMEQIDGMITDLETVARQSVRIAEEAQVVLSEIAQIDFASLNGSLADLDAAVKAFSGLDIETLNRAIANLNDTVEPLARFFAKFQ